MAYIPEFFKELEEQQTPTISEEMDKADKELEDSLVSDYMEKVSRKNAIDSLMCNINTIQQGFSRVWPTGIDSLDKALDGGFRGKQLIFLGAISSLGKTSLALQICDNIAKSGRDVLIFSLEMDSDELLAKSISRESYLLSCGDKAKERYRFTTQDITGARIGTIGESRRDFFEECLESVRSANEHLFYYIGENNVSSDTIKGIVELHKRARGEAPFVLVDYLQILQPSDSKDSISKPKRLLIDDDVTKLKILARDYEIPVLVISAFNRDSYLQEVSTSSFKESSGIEYSSDILLGMQYKGLSYREHKMTIDGKTKYVYEGKQYHENRVRKLFNKMDEANIRPLELKVLKSRNGKKGTVPLWFYAPYNYFSERELDGAPRDTPYSETEWDLRLDDTDQTEDGSGDIVEVI